MLRPPALSHPVLLMGWLSLVLCLDRDAGGGGIWLQRGLGIATWGVLLIALHWFTPLVRTQALVVVAFAAVIELVFSPTLEVYLYRFENVPAYVPPGHGWSISRRGPWGTPRSCVATSPRCPTPW